MRLKNTWVCKVAYGAFYLAVIIEVLLVIIDKSNYTNPLEGRLFQLTFLLFFTKVCLTKYTWKEYVCIFLFCMLGAVSYFITGRNEIIRLIVFMAACKGIDMQRCLKLVFWLTLVGCTLIILLSVSGIYGGISLTQDYGRGEIETRYTLGMGHPNALQCMVWTLTALGIYLFGGSIKWVGYIIVLGINFLFFLVTDSKTGLLVSIFSIVLFWTVAKCGSAIVRKVIGFLGIFISLGSILVSVIIAANAYRIYEYIWHDDRSPITMLFYYLNNFLNGRIRILASNVGFKGTIATWTLFGEPENEYFFDLGWIRLFYWYGIIPGCIFVVGLVILLLYYLKKRDVMSIALITSISLYNIAEAHVISRYLARNYIFFLMGAVWYIIVSGDEKEEKSVGKVD